MTPPLKCYNVTDSCKMQGPFPAALSIPFFASLLIFQLVVPYKSVLYLQQINIVAEEHLQ